ncbi:aminotransferase class I and II [soil metagenome]
MRTIIATRYVTPLREGGSLPAIVEADDDGLYVLKFRGAGQGVKALIAELVAGEIARAAGLRVPEIVFVELDAELARTEPDPEIQDLIRASVGLNLALDYLPGSITFDPLAEKPDAMLASKVVWLDAFVSNLDRTARNTNMLVWHGQLWLIDHGAALYFHHGGGDFQARASSPFPLIADHVLLPLASCIERADEEMTRLITPAVIEAIVALIPDVWLTQPVLQEQADTVETPDEIRAAYLRYFEQRLRAPRAFVQEAIRARSLHL